MADFDIHDKLLQTHEHPKGAKYYSPFAGKWYKWNVYTNELDKWICIAPPPSVLAQLFTLPTITQQVGDYAHGQIRDAAVLIKETSPIDKGEKYRRQIGIGDDGKSDIYDVLRAFQVTDPAHAHGIKKVVCPGQRGDKDIVKDLEEGINSLQMYLAYIKQGIAGA